jgi:hypothetical protein
MPRRLRFSLANVLLTVTCFALAVGWWATVEPPKPKAWSDRWPGDAAIQNLPLTISLSEEVGLGGSWYFSVNSAGDGELTINYPKNVIQSVKVSPIQLDELRELLIHEKFFELRDEYGEHVPDGGSQTLTISVGESSKTIRIYFLANWVAGGEKAKLLEPARALRVWMLIRGWFSHPNAADSRAYDQRVLDAVSQPVKSGT